MVMDTRDELIPFRTGFDQVWHGYDRGQVQQYMQSVDTEVRMLAADRDAAAAHGEELTRQLEQAREENRQLRGQVNRISRSPIDAEALTERLGHMLQLAQAEADEILTRARAAAANMQAAARQADDQRRRRHDRLVAELDERRRELEAEHRDVLRRATEQAERTTREADERRRELDEAAATARAQADAEAQAALAASRAAATREIDELTTTAQRDAARMVGTAKHEVEQLNHGRDEVATALAGTLALLADAQSVLLPESPQEARPSAAA